MAKARCRIFLPRCYVPQGLQGFAVAILITAGPRSGELLALEIRNIHLDDGYIWIHQMEDTKTYQLLDYIKEGKAKSVALNDDALRILKACLEFRMADPSDSPYLLLNPCSKDGKLHLRALDDFMRGTIHKKVLGYGDEKEARSPHDCRRTYASLEYLNGTPIYYIKEQLGHKSVSQTWDYIKNVVGQKERRDLLKGTQLFSDDE